MAKANGFDYNYLHLLKAYYHYDLAGCFNSNSPIVFLAILDIANKLQWEKWISISNEELSKKTHLSIPTIKRVKQKMKTGGYHSGNKLVKIKAGNSHTSPEYAINYEYLSTLHSEIPKPNHSADVDNTSVQTDPQDDSEGQIEPPEVQTEPPEGQNEPSPDQIDPPPNSNVVISNSLSSKELATLDDKDLPYGGYQLVA